MAYPPLVTVRTVEAHPEFEGVWCVRTHDAVPEPERETFATYTTQAAAWYEACWSRFHESNTLPKISPGNWFASMSRVGYTSDPRFAQTVPADSVDAETRGRIDRAIVRFIRAKVGDMSDLEAFFPEDMTPDTLPEGEQLDSEPEPEPPAESPAEVERHPAPADTPEPVRDDPRDSLSDAERQAFDNFTDLADNAPSEGARTYWRNRAAEIFAGVIPAE